MDYLPIFGPNTHQWWVYDETNDVYINPPAAVLDNIKLKAARVYQMYPDIRLIDIERILLSDTIIAELIDIRYSWLTDKKH